MNWKRVGALNSLMAIVVFGVSCTDDVDRRRTSLYELQRSEGIQAADDVRAYLADESPDVRATALNVLVGLRVDDAEQLCLKAFDDPSGFVRAIAAKLLGDLRAVDAVGPLAVRLQQDADPWVRQRAAEALGEIGGAEATEALKQGMSDPIQMVRRAAIAGVRGTDPSAAKPELARILLDDASWECRVQAARALGLANDSEYIPALIQAQDDENEFVRAAAGNALKLIRGESTLTQPQAPKAPIADAVGS